VCERKCVCVYVFDALMNGIILVCVCA